MPKERTTREQLCDLSVEIMKQLVTVAVGEDDEGIITEPEGEAILKAWSPKSRGVEKLVGRFITDLDELLWWTGEQNKREAL